MNAITSPDTMRAARLFDFTPLPDADRPVFATAEAAWFWTMAQLDATRDSAARHPTTDAVVKAVDQLYRQRRIDMAHARILRIWGERGCAPDSDPDLRLWLTAMVEMSAALRLRGIVRRPA
jgi:hypothetical protein